MVPHPALPRGILDWWRQGTEIPHFTARRMTKNALLLAFHPTRQTVKKEVSTQGRERLKLYHRALPTLHAVHASEICHWATRKCASLYPLVLTMRFRTTSYLKPLRSFQRLRVNWGLPCRTRRIPRSRQGLSSCARLLERTLPWIFLYRWTG